MNFVAMIFQVVDLDVPASDRWRHLAAPLTSEIRRQLRKSEVLVQRFFPKADLMEKIRKRHPFIWYILTYPE